MAGQYSVEQESMAKGAQAVDDAHAQIQGHVRSLDGAVNEMFGGWKSQASGRFAMLHQRWVEEQNKLTTALTDMHTALVQTDKAYQAQEDAASTSFDHISSGI
jgi:WXG100 family type VII secretion target